MNLLVSSTLGLIFTVLANSCYFSTTSPIFSSIASLAFSITIFSSLSITNLFLFSSTFPSTACDFSPFSSDANSVADKAFVGVAGGISPVRTLTLLLTILFITFYIFVKNFIYYLHSLNLNLNLKVRKVN